MALSKEEKATRAREYRQRPYVKAKAQKYRQRPYVKAKAQSPEKREKDRAYLQRPEVIARRQSLEAKARSKAWKQIPKNKDKERLRLQSPKLKTQSRAWYVKTRHTSYGRYQGMRNSARGRKMPNDTPIICTITAEEYYSILPPNGAPCPVCRNAMWLGDKKHAPSNDRRDNSKGYVTENVAIICRECNGLKREVDATRLYRLGMYSQGLIG